MAIKNRKTAEGNPYYGFAYIFNYPFFFRRLLVMTYNSKINADEPNKTAYCAATLTSLSKKKMVLSKALRSSSVISAGKSFVSSEIVPCMK